MLQMANIRKVEVTNLISGLWDPLRIPQNDMVGENEAILDSRNSQNTCICVLIESIMPNISCNR